MNMKGEKAAYDDSNRSLNNRGLLVFSEVEGQEQVEDPRPIDN